MTKKKIHFVLASASKYRVGLLKVIGYVPDEICPSDIDETPLKKERPKVLAKRLAIEKAKVAAQRFPDSLVLTADTVCCKGCLVLPKAMNEEEAEFCIRRLSGGSHRLYTGVCGIYKGHRIVKVGETRVKMKRLSEEEIKMFLTSRNWYGKAGGYGIQGFVSAFIKSTKGSTQGNIIGFPLYETYKILTSLGLKPDLSVLEK